MSVRGARYEVYGSSLTLNPRPYTLVLRCEELA